MESHWFYYFAAVVGNFRSASGHDLWVKAGADSLTIGALMNTRGLMELIVLNIGLELKVLTQRCLP
jgi:Kef-type K+ transport system membrane component KefB